MIEIINYLMYNNNKFYYNGERGVSEYIHFELEQNNYYKTNEIDFKDDDIIIDIGANIGLFSITIAKKYPNIKIYAYEPFEENYKVLLKNIEINGIKNIIPSNKFVANKSNEKIKMRGTPANFGGSEIMLDSITTEKTIVCEMDSISLDDIIDNRKIKFLKIDCEGSEYSILYNSKQLSNIEYLGGEFHTTHKNKDEKFTPNVLEDYLKAYIHNVFHEDIFMSEETDSLVMELT